MRLPLLEAAVHLTVPDLGRRRLAAAGRALPVRQLRGAAVEVARIGAHVVLYPLGLRRDRADEAAGSTLDGLPPLRRGLVVSDVEAAGTPILLLHGLADNRSIFGPLRRSLLRRGFGRVVTLNYSVLTRDVPLAAARLGEQVEQLCAETGYERLHVVGHSLGGLIARYYVQRLGGDARVHTLVTIGTPHGGSRAAHLFPAGVVGQLRPGSPLLRELSRPAPGCRTRFLVVYSDLDQLVVPRSGGRLEHPDLAARHLLRSGVGHLSLAADRHVAHEIAATLARLDSSGRVVTNAGLVPEGSTP